MSTAEASGSVQTTKTGRSSCYKARDVFYQCVRETGVNFSRSGAIPVKCQKIRILYENSCLASWVRHFDEQQEKDTREAKRLQASIQQRAKTAAGSLEGK